MITLLIALLAGTVVCFCHGLPASVSEAQSVASQNVHLYLKNSSDALDSQLVPVISEIKNTNDQIEDERDALLPFLAFLFDTLGKFGEEMEDCLDDIMINLIPDDPDGPDFVPTEPTEITRPIIDSKPIITDTPVKIPDAVISNITTK